MSRRILGALILGSGIALALIPQKEAPQVPVLNGVKEKPTLLFFTASWCVPCQKFKQNVLVNPEVQAVLEKWSLVVLEIDENKEAAKHWDVKAVPTFIQVRSGKRRTGTFLTSQELLQWINSN